MTRRLCAIVLASCVLLPSFGAGVARADDLASYVNPFVGTLKSHRGHSDIGSTFPGAAVPFGMLQWSPDTPSPLAGGYNYAASSILGFSVRHLSGPGCAYTAYGDFPILPSASAPSGDFSWSPAGFSHNDERAAPGSYDVTLAGGIGAHLAVGKRFGVGDFTFPGSTGSILIDAARAAAPTAGSSIDIVSPDTITGESISGMFCYLPLEYHAYVAMRFDRPFASAGAWVSGTNNSLTPALDALAVPGATHGTGGWATFDTLSDHDVRVKVAVSYVSRANALENLDTAPSWDERSIALRARSEWDQLLNKVQVSGGTTEQNQTFYTALYHSLLQPSAFSDANGEYIGYDGAVHQAAGYTQYTDFSGWDTYRSLIQLQSILAPRQVADMVRSLLADEAQGGWLPRWGLANYDTGIMVGDPADAIIANAFAYGVRDFDARAALAAMLKGATQTGPGYFGYTMSRPGLADYESKGYVPMGIMQMESIDEASSEFEEAARNYVPANAAGVWGPTATTLEYAIADSAIARFAEALGDDGTAELFDRRAQSWQNVFDPSQAMPRPKDASGAWTAGFVPTNEVGFTEGNALQYTFVVPQNVRAVIDALGGDEPAIARLDDLFSQLNVGPLGAHAWLGDEPGIGTPYAYLYAGVPYKTQALLRRVLGELYAPTPDGLAGNDDLGALSAEYVWGAIGIHPGRPGTSEMLIGSPIFSSVDVALPDGGTMSVRAPDAAQNAYVASATLDGAPLQRAWLDGSFHSQGGRLDLMMDAQPNLAWGTGPSERPPSSSAGQSDAIGSVSPDATTVAPGGSSTITLGAANASDAPRSVRWEIPAQAGLHFEPSSGTLDLAAAGRSGVHVTVTADATAAVGERFIPVAMSANAGAAMPRVVIDLTVSPA